MPLGQLIYNARIDFSLLEKIKALAEQDAKDGYPGLKDYMSETVNFDVDPIEGTRWVEIQLGADSFRESEWCAAHRIISCIRYAKENEKDMVDDEWMGEKSLAVNEHYINVQPFEPTKNFEDWFKEDYKNLTPEQLGHAAIIFYGLKYGDIPG